MIRKYGQKTPFIMSIWTLSKWVTRGWIRNVSRHLNPQKAHRFTISIILTIGAVFFSPLQIITTNSHAAARTISAQDGALARLVQTPRIKPPAPGPVHLLPSDYKHLKSILENSKNRRWSSVLSTINKIQHPDAISLGQWYYFDARDPNVDIVAGSAFLDTHPQWPSLTRIQRHLESRISDNTDTQTIYKFFQSRDPLTGNGKLHFVRALIARGDIEAAKLHLRASWRDHQFSSSQERTILRLYRQYLTTEDHIARVDSLLWRRQVTSSRRSFSLLPTRERRKAEARAALYVRARNAQRLYNALPTEDKQDAGVIHAAIRYFRRSDQEGRAIDLVRTAPDDPVALRNPSRFWNERNLLMRWALRNGRFADAYDMAHKHGLEPGLELAEAEFAAGWIALRFLNEPARGEDHFLALANWATSPISTARAYYWLGRGAKARNQQELADQRFALAAHHIYTYYGQLAAEELGGVLAQQKFAPTAFITDADREIFSNRPTTNALGMISDLNDSRSLLIFTYGLDDQLETPGEFSLLAEITQSENAPHLTVRTGKTAVRNKTLIPEISYPMIVVPESARRFTPPEIILGLSRQESEFNPSAYSSAGARGMMQLLPATAQLTARKEKIPYSRGALLSDPYYNMTIGSAHLSHLIERFNDSLILTFVGYNAGPHRSTRFSREYGDPLSNSVDPIDWVELIPFSETRNYVQRVLENIQIYRARLTDSPIAGNLMADLDRGGNKNRAGQLKNPSIHLLSLRPESDRRPLPPLSRRTIALINEAPLKLDGARPAVDHLDKSITLPPPSIQTEAQKKSTPQSLLQTTSEVGLQINATPAPSLKAGNTKATLPRAPQLSPITNAPPLEDEEICKAYRELLAQKIEKTEKTAKDLNTAMLEELRLKVSCEDKMQNTITNEEAPQSEQAQDTP